MCVRESICSGGAYIPIAFIRTSRTTLFVDAVMPESHKLDERNRIGDESRLPEVGFIFKGPVGN